MIGARSPVSMPLPATADQGARVARLVVPGPARTAYEAPIRRRFPSLRALSFLAVVMLPVATAAVYYSMVAADQFVSEFRLSLRTVDAPRVEALTLFSGQVAQMAASSESQIVAQYIASRAIVDALDPDLDLRKLFSAPEADWWARLWLPASIEQLVYYWRNQVDPFYDTSTGTIVVRVRAFTPNDSLSLAQAIVSQSEKLINDLSARARRDTVGLAEAELVQTEARLKAVLAQIRDFRDRQQLIDPGKTADATAALANKLRDELLKANAELTTLKAYMRDDAPAVRVLKARIRALDIQLHGLARELTDDTKPATPALSQTLGAYEALEAERKFAELAYQHALEGLDRARDNADRQHIYIASFVPPSLPESSLYPHRWRSVGIVALVAFAMWAIGALMLQSIRDHL
jgi:capsular polysaccharide transport system permease protein